MSSLGTFPFGQPVLEVTQTDRTPKDVFVLGVYASAVHARWVSVDGKELVKALAVASEPEIFWRGCGAEAIIEHIAIPEKAGRLDPASGMFNGPSGRALDERILEPLELGRGHAWLCDLVPHSCANPGQLRAIKRAYEEAAGKYGLAEATVPPVPVQLADEARRRVILDEIEESGARVLIFLGDMPIRWFLAHYDRRWRTLEDFRGEGLYGQLVEAKVGGRRMQVLPLAHPRQVGRLGMSADKWYEVHEMWMGGAAWEVGKSMLAGSTGG